MTVKMYDALAEPVAPDELTKLSQSYLHSDRRHGGVPYNVSK